MSQRASDRSLTVTRYIVVRIGASHYISSTISLRSATDQDRKRNSRFRAKTIGEERNRVHVITHEWRHSIHGATLWPIRFSSYVHGALKLRRLQDDQVPRSLARFLTHLCRTRSSPFCLSSSSPRLSLLDKDFDFFRNSRTAKRKTELEKKVARSSVRLVDRLSRHSCLFSSGARS